jgi:hypothetical protein
MSISGKLEDVSAADVMQFIHLGRRTGTLVLEQRDQKAMVGFHRGKLISARREEQPLVGDLLVRAGLLDPERLSEAIREQQRRGDHSTLGQILLDDGAIQKQELRDAVVSQIKQTIGEIVQWDDGRFEFVVDDLRPVDDISLLPGDVLEESDLNTQMVLLEAARIFDERNRRDAERGPLDDRPPAAATATPAAAAAPPIPGPLASSPMATARVRIGGRRTDAGGSSRRRPSAAMAARQPVDDDTHPPFQLTGDPVVSETTEIRVATADEVFFARFREACRWLGVPVRRVELSAATAGLADSNPVILVDLRQPERRIADLRSICRSCPETPVVALIDEGFPVAHAYGAGAMTALPADPEAVTACVSNLLHNLQAARRGRSLPVRAGHGAVARLRRVFGDLRSGLITATVALNLMHIISESVERAVLFLVRDDTLTVLGAFGEAHDGRPLAEVTRSLRIPLSEDCGLCDCVALGEMRSFELDQVGLPASFMAVLGTPTTRQSVIFPVLGTQRVIAAVYADNGLSEELIEDIEILELAAAQVGMAFENELLRHRLARGDF